MKNFKINFEITKKFREFKNYFISSKPNPHKSSLFTKISLSLPLHFGPPKTSRKFNKIVFDTYGFVISCKHRLRIWVSWPRYLNEYSTKPGYGRFGWPEDVLVVSSSPLHVLEPLCVLTSPDEDDKDDLLLWLRLNLPRPPFNPLRLPRLRSLSNGTP